MLKESVEIFGIGRLTPNFMMGLVPPMVIHSLPLRGGGIGPPLKKNPNITGDKIILQVYLEDCQMVINSDSITNMLYI